MIDVDNTNITDNDDVHLYHDHHDDDKFQTKKKIKKINTYVGGSLYGGEPRR